MSTLTTERSSPVRVLQVLADFRHGMPRSGTVYVGAERHRVRVNQTAGGLVGKCSCPGGCFAIRDAIEALQTLAGAWERVPRSGVHGIEFGDSADSGADTKLRRRSYDGIAWAMCEADLVSIEAPPWAYDERGIRRPVVHAEIAHDIWHEVQRRLDRLLGESESAERAYQLPLLRYYWASWEMDRELARAWTEGNRELGAEEDG